VKFACCQERRLDVLRRSGSANAIEFIEALDRAAPAGAPRQQTLFVRLLRSGFTLSPDNIRIVGGERIAKIGIEWVAAANALPPQAEPNLVAELDELSRTLVVRTDTSGDFSRYTFSIVSGIGSEVPPADFDTQLSSIEFSFKVECPSDFDCTAQLACPPPAVRAPNIDYLAKDYAGFRRLMLDRMSLLAPSWTERSAADVGVAVVELLAFAADTLSYRQDTIVNEAYLSTARRRTSIRRHARLVDYRLHEGCNARALVHFEVSEGAGPQVLPTHSRLLTRGPVASAVFEPGDDERRTLEAGALVFETVREATLRRALNRLSFYTWGDAGCCLPRGATNATLRGHATGLTAGDMLIFVEEVSPTTFHPKDADQTHRHAVRLTKVSFDSDPSGQLFNSPPVDGPEEITRIEWDAGDALPFALCISVAARPGLEISAALGNIVLADHGETVSDEALQPLPAPAMPYATIETHVGDCCEDEQPRRRPPLRYRPTLEHAPLTHGFDLDALLAAAPGDEYEAWWSVAALRALDPHQATPRAILESTLGAVTDTWRAQPDLLASGANMTHFVAEIEDDGQARLRFGDDAHGRRPSDGTSFLAHYRVGNGVAGNVGADAIAHLVMKPALAIDAIKNPLPAFGGIEPEDIEAARRDAPQAFRTQERAVTAEDYARAAERRSEVQRAAASFRWTGSWHTVFVTADRLGGGAVDAPFEVRLRRHLERFRMAGYDLEVNGPRYAALDVMLHLCVKPAYFRSEVVRAARAVLSSRLLSNGERGIFHPDNFSFGEPVYLSRIVAAAQAIEGVESVRVDRFQRLVDPSPATLDNGVIPMGRLEIAQLEDNPNFRERGILKITAGGGK
jgi:hypothetical protein